jgi:hypothetical protein
MKTEARRLSGRLAATTMLLCAGLAGCSPAKTQVQPDTASIAPAEATSAKEEALALEPAPVEPAATSIPMEDVTAMAQPVAPPATIEIAEPVDDAEPAVAVASSPVVEVAVPPDATAARTNTMPLAVPVNIRVDDAHWLGEPWTKRAPVSFDALTDTNISEYLVTVPLEYREGMRQDFGDVRFTLEDGAKAIRYALEEVVAGQTAKATVLVPTLSGGLPPLVFLYYGNPEATTTADAKLLGAATPEVPRPTAQVNLSTEREVKYAIVPPMEPPPGVTSNPSAVSNEVVIPPPPPALGAQAGQ